jgi:hypothetical protein
MTDLKSLYPGNAPVTEEETKKIWSEAFFVFDSNTWLDFYRLSEKRSSELLKIVDKIDKRLYIHVKIVQEFLKNRVDCVNNRVETKGKLCKELDNIRSSFDAVKEEIEFDSTAKDSILKAIEAKLKTLNEHIAKLKDSGLRDEFTDLFFTKFLKYIFGIIPTKQDEIDALTKDHKERLAKKLPPSDGDEAKKDPVDAAGDLLIWKQSMDKAKELNKPLILVTSDGTTANQDKCGWFMKRSNINPVSHPYLIQEFYRHTNNMLVILKPIDFIEAANKYIELNASPELIQELTEKQRSKSKRSAIYNWKVATDKAVENAIENNRENMNASENEGNAILSLQALRLDLAYLMEELEIVYELDSIKFGDLHELIRVINNIVSACQTIRSNIHDLSYEDRIRIKDRVIPVLHMCNKYIHGPHDDTFSLRQLHSLMKLLHIALSDYLSIYGIPV